MVFSPPDQRANAKREKEELELKEAERAARIQKARDSGMLLVFSPTFSRPAQYKDQDKEQEDEKQKKVPARTKSPATNCRSKDDGSYTMSKETAATPQDMEVELARNDSKSLMSSFGMPMSEEGTSERITDELKNLRETIHQLVEQSKQQPETSREQLQALDLQTQRQLLRTENLSKANSKLEEKNQALEFKLKEIESVKAHERESLITQNTRLETELAATNRETIIQIQGLEEVRKNLEMQLSGLNREKSVLSSKVSSLGKEMLDAREALHESKMMVEALKSEFNTEKIAMEDDRKSLVEAKSKLSIEFDRIKSSNASLNKTIESYENKIAALEQDLLPESEEQLRHALSNIRRLERAEVESKAKLSQYETEIEMLKEMMEALKQQKEEERSNFQTLNESSHQAYENMMKDLAEKNATIEELKRKLSSTEERLSREATKVDQLQDDMTRIQSKMDEQMEDLRQSLTSSMEALDNAAIEKKELQQKLEKACEQIDKDHKFMDEMLSASKDKSVALEEIDKLRMVMQRKIEDLERQLRKRTDERDHAQERMATFTDREGTHCPLISTVERKPC